MVLIIIFVSLLNLHLLKWAPEKFELTGEQRSIAAGEFMTLGPQRIHSKPWGPLSKVNVRTRQRKFQYMEFRPDTGWSVVRPTGWVWRRPFKQMSRILVRSECITDGGLYSRPWGSARLLVSRKGSSSAGAHGTGCCDFKDLQAACSPDRCWGSNSMEQFKGALSTTLYDPS